MGNFEGSCFTGEQSGLNDVMYVVNLLSVYTKLTKSIINTTYFSDEGLSDGLILKARVGELIIVIIRWRPITMVTRAGSSY